MNLKLDKKPIRTAVRDTFDRPLNDLRISVIDQCNFRCTYCMPDENRSGQYSFLKENSWLTFNEIERCARLFVRLGVTKLRLTGGEPLLRPKLYSLIEQLRNIEDITDLALTTNGSLLATQAQSLKDAGLNRVTVSLDALNDQVFRSMNGQRSDVQKVLEGIQKCEDVGFEQIKINCVIQKNVNDNQILDLVKYFKGRKSILRFIEYMDVGNCNHWHSEHVVASSDIVTLINAHYPIEAMNSNYDGEVATRYRFLDGSGELGFVSSITQPFCRSCSRARLSTDGKLYTCLFAHEGMDLRAHLRREASDDELLTILQSVWSMRSDRYSELRSNNSLPKTSSPKVEMFKIGG